MKCLVVFTAVALSIGESAIAGESLPLDPTRHGGPLFFSVGGGPHRSTAGSNATTGALVYVGLGYRITDQFSLAIRFYTGSESVDADAGRPVSGTLAMGGAGLDATILLPPGGMIRPFVAFGYDLMNILVKPVGPRPGYTGGGVHVALGLCADLSQFFSLAIRGSYSVILYHDAVLFAASGGEFLPFVDRRFGVSLDVSFFPRLW